MNIDMPNGNNSTLSGVTTLAGWAFDTAEPIASVEVIVDPDLNLVNSVDANYAALGGSRQTSALPTKMRRIARTPVGAPFSTPLTSQTAHTP